MNKKTIIGVIGLIVALVIVFFLITNKNKKEETEELETNEITATVLSVSGDTLTVQDKDDIIYTFNDFDTEETLASGQHLTLSYTGDLDKDTEFQTVSIIKCTKLDNDDIETMMEDKSAFSVFYKQAKKKLDKMTLKEKAGQVLLVGAPEKNQAELLKDNPYSGYILYKRDFENKSTSQVQSKIRTLQNASDIPLLIAVDEEGGTVVRVGSNPKLIENEFKSPQELYKAGGMDAIKQDTIDKSKILNNLGINLNLAPVVDVATDPKAYIYYRTIGENTNVTSEYARTVINASKGTGVSYTLKHFPGYGNNVDTHESESVDDRTFDEIRDDDLPPFIAGTKAGAEAVLVSHNIIKSIDPDEPASLSASVHNLLRNTVGFSGISITDDLSMKAIKDDAPLVKALLAGNDLLIVTDSTNSIDQIVNAVRDGKLDEKVVDRAALRVIAWKYYKGLFATSK